MISSTVFCLCFILTSILMVAARNITCPDQIPCDCKEEMNTQKNLLEKIIDCENKNLLEVPNFINFIDETFDALLLGNNKISALGRSAFNGLTVTKIDLSNNPDLTSFSNYAFKGVNGLQVLMIENGRLLSVPVAFEKLTELRELHLSNNNIRALSGAAFSSMSELRYLDLSNNKAEFPRPFTAFETLKKLEYLNLDKNGLYNPPIDALQSSPDIHTLILSNNKIRTMPLNVLQGLKKLKRLELVGNRLNIPKGRLFQGLDLEVLSIGGCDLGEITPNVLSSIPNVRNLTIRDCHVTSIPKGTFKILKKLEYLDISGNPVGVSRDIFDGIEGKLTTLKLDKMNLVEYPLELLARFSRLKDISLNGNNMTFLPGGIFKNLPNAGSRIYVERNNIHKVSKHVMDGARKPVSLFLANNHIKSLAFIVRHPCRFVNTYVDMRGNPVHCNCNTYGMVQHKIFDLIGTCHTPHHHRGLHLIYTPDNDDQVLHFEKSINATDECTNVRIKPRHEERYDCGCRTWIDYNSPQVCAVTGHASQHLMHYSTFFVTLMMPLILLVKN